MTECERCQELMSEMLDCELSEPQKTRLTDHISRCPDCARLYDAFAFISSSLDDGAEPPQALAENVMAAVRAGKVVPISAARKKRRAAARLFALAACLALVVFVAGKAGVSLPGARLSSAVAPAAFRSGDDSSSSEIPESEPGDAANGAGGTLFSSDYTDPEDGDETPAGKLQASPELFSFPQSTDSPQNPDELLPVAENVPPPAANTVGTESGASLLSVSMIELYSGDLKEPDRDPIVTVTDEPTLRFIMDLLEINEAGDGEPVIKGDPVFILNVTTLEGDVYSVSVWIIDGRLWCMSDEDQVLYVAAGDAGDLFALIAAA